MNQTEALHVRHPEETYPKLPYNGICKGNNNQSDGLT
jgi:hypothetical protein